MKQTVLYALILSMTGVASTAGAQVNAATTQASQGPSVTDLMTPAADRALRAISLAYEKSDTLDFVVLPIQAVVNPTLLEPEALERKVIVENPDRGLWKGSVVIRPGDWFLSIEEYAVAYGQLADYKKLLVARAGGLTGASPDDIAGSLSVGRRLLGGLTVKFAASQRPQVQDGNLVDRFVNDDPRAETYSIKLDLGTLAGPTAKQRASLYASLNTHAKLFGAAGIPDLPTCEASRTCLAWLSSTSNRLGALLPTLEYETVDQFDLNRWGGAYSLVGPASNDKLLWTFKATWDLKSVFDVGGRRAEAVAALKTAQDSTKWREKLQVKGGQERHASGEFVFMTLSVEPAVEAEWKFDGNSCGPGIKLSKSGTLAGIAPASCEVKVKATAQDGSQREASATLRISGSQE
jgi:hypothetical protein